MGPRTVVLALFGVLLAMGVPFFVSHHLQLGARAKSPQEATVTLGGKVVVAGGRAKLWFAGGVSGADFEVSCSKETKYFQPDGPGSTHSACGIDVEFVEVNDENGPLRGKFKITWQ